MLVLTNVAALTAKRTNLKKKQQQWKMHSNERGKCCSIPNQMCGKNHMKKC